MPRRVQSMPFEERRYNFGAPALMSSSCRPKHQQERMGSLQAQRRAGKMGRLIPTQRYSWSITRSVKQARTLVPRRRSRNSTMRRLIRSSGRWLVLGRWPRRGMRETARKQRPKYRRMIQQPPTQVFDLDPSLRSNANLAGLHNGEQNFGHRKPMATT